MDLQRHYEKLVNYDEWANLEVIAFLRKASAPPDRSVKWIAHIIAAEQLWLARILQRESPLPVWPELSIDRCEQQVRELAQSWKDYLAAGSNLLEQTVSYKNSKGEPWTSAVQDILTHVFMHSAYHRGQIAADMRQSGQTPAYTDFIHSVRRGLVE